MPLMTLNHVLLWVHQGVICMKAYFQKLYEKLFHVNLLSIAWFPTVQLLNLLDTRQFPLKAASPWRLKYCVNVIHATPRGTLFSLLLDSIWYKAVNYVNILWIQNMHMKGVCSNITIGGPGFINKSLHLLSHCYVKLRS